MESEFFLSAVLSSFGESGVHLGLRTRQRDEGRVFKAVEEASIKAGNAKYHKAF